MAIVMSVKGWRGREAQQEVEVGVGAKVGGMYEGYSLAGTYMQIVYTC